MTTLDIAGLCERDMEYLREALAFQANIADAGGLITTARVCREAADALERQAAEIERLRGALRQLTENAVCARGCGLKDDEDGIVSGALFDTIMQARAALTGKDTATLGLSGKTQTDARTRGDA
jgi:hypothetical protein